jgi:hypothetical protein
MSHKDAPPLTFEQQEVMAFYQPRLAKQGVTVGWGRDKHGNFLSTYAQDALAAWQAAKREQLRMIHSS